MGVTFWLAIALFVFDIAPVAAGPLQPRLVVLFAPCTVSTASLSPYNPKVDFTPSLSAFAKQSVVFRRHQTETPQSGPAFASIFSGSQADHHQVYRNPSRLPDSVYVMAEAFAENGYETFYWVGHPAASRATNFHQGVGENNLINGYLEASDPRFIRILEKLAEDDDYRAFVMTTPVLTHAPYRIKNWTNFQRAHPDKEADPGSEVTERLVEQYQQYHHLLTWNFPEAAKRLLLSGIRLERMAQVVERLFSSTINSLDELFGSIVKAIDANGLRRESLIAFTADHGEIMYRPNALFQWSHGMQLAQEVLNVPWIVRAPGLTASVYEGVTRSIDVFPTLAGLAGISLTPERGVDGQDLTQVLLGREPPPSLVASSHTTLLAKSVFDQMHEPRFETVWAVMRSYYPRVDVNLIWVSMRDGDMVYKHRKVEPERWEYQAFDLAKDPGETTNLYNPEDPRHRKMALALAQYKARLVAQAAGPQEGALPLQQEGDLLRDLGYIR